jgi:two-component system, OmpR family, response regulator
VVGQTGGVRILIVEDEERLAAAVARGLRAEGFDVEVVGDGLDGYWRARHRPYGAIVLDILLPGMNGYQICRKLRDDGVQTPILMLTAKDGEYDEAEAFELGADDYLRKPFSYVVLVARLRALQRRGELSRPATLSLGDLRFDPATRVCRRGDTPISLTGRESSLLEYRQVRIVGCGLGSRRRPRPQCGRGLHRLSATQSRPPVQPVVNTDSPRSRISDGGR